MTAHHNGIPDSSHRFVPYGTQQPPPALHAVETQTHVLYRPIPHSTRTNLGSSTGDRDGGRGLMLTAEEAYEHGERGQNNAEHGG